MSALLHSLVVLAQQTGASAQTAADAAAQAPTPWYGTIYGILAILVLIFVVPFPVGSWLSRWLRMPDVAWKLTLILMVFLAAVLVTYIGWPPKKGIDLAGGTTLVYEIDESKREAGAAPVPMSDLINALQPRVDPAGVKQVTIRQYGENAIEVTIPEVNQDEVEEIKRNITTTGHLEFRILANPQIDEKIAADAMLVDWEVRDLTDASRADAEQAEIIALAEKSTPSVVIVDIKERARWINVSEDQAAQVTADKDLVTRTVGKQLQKLVMVGPVKARWVEVGREDETKTLRIPPEPSIVYRARPEGGIDVLVLIDKENVNGGYLDLAQPGRSESGDPLVNFGFDAEGARRFARLTEDNLPRQGRMRRLGILLDDVLLSAPNIKSVISSQGQIEGGFTQKEVDWLVNVLRAGSLPAALNPKPMSEQLTNPTLGEDTIRQGLRAIVISMIAILVFMPLYYRFSGLVAGVVLMFNILLVLAIMVALKAPLTLSGMAGLALTVGMAVDANVLIYERLREELQRGSALRMAIRNGFARATRTIIDSNLTTVLTGVALYVIGTDQIKGFAVTLILGIVMSMFTAVFCARVVFDVFEKQRWISQLKMARILGRTEIDFMGLAKWCGVASALVIVVGIAAVVLRGKDMLDIDLQGGTKLQIVLVAPQSRAEVERQLKEYSNTQPEDQRLVAATVTSIGDAGKVFDVETTQSDLDVVKQSVRKVFGEQLKANHVSFDSQAVKTIVPTTTPTKPGEVKPATAPASEATSAPAGDQQQDTKQPPASAPPAEKSGAAKPAENAPAPAPGNGGAEKSSDNPATPPPAPKKEEGAGLDFDVSRLLAQADDAQPPAAAGAPVATDATAPPEAKAAAPTKGEATDAEKPQPASGDKPADDTPSGEQPATQESAVIDDTEIYPDLPQSRFIGGTAVELKFEEKVNQEVLGGKLEDAGKAVGLSFDFEVKNRNVVGKSLLAQNDWLVKVTLGREDTLRLLDQLKTAIATEPAFPAATTIKGQVARGAQRQAIAAMFCSLLIIIGYLWIRFEKMIFGLAAVVALIHDVLVTFGLLALSKYLFGIPVLGEALLLEPFRINLVIVAALLTIVGYSINDTIVVFDRIRELKGKSPNLTSELVNTSINQTLSRTILTALTTFIVVVILYFYGGPGVHGFAYTMVVGVVVGTYSSIYIAAPLVLWMESREQGQQRGRVGERSRAPVAS